MKQEVFSRRGPAVLIEGESACGDETVQMEMILESLVPGVKHSDDAESSPQMGLAKLQQGLGNSLKQQAQQNLFATEDEAV